MVDADPPATVDVDGNDRAVAFTMESPNGNGNLVAKALPVTIDPGTDVFLERRDSRPSPSIRSRSASTSSVVIDATGVEAPSPGSRYRRTVLR